MTGCEWGKIDISFILILKIDIRFILILKDFCVNSNHGNIEIDLVSDYQ